eukprot:15364753-Ditylum_brightwellii.AAC.1
MYGDDVMECSDGSNAHTDKRQRGPQIWHAVRVVVFRVRKNVIDRVVLSIKSYGDVYATGENLVAPGRI